MNNNGSPESPGGKAMEFLIPLAVVVVWVILQAWVLPRLGVQT